MNKKILGATVILTFFLLLTVTSNIQESDNAEHAADQETYAAVHDMTEEKDGMSAGADMELSTDSFTTESDEAAEVEKRDTAIVAAPEETAAAETEEEQTETEKEQEQEQKEQEQEQKEQEQTEDEQTEDEQREDTAINRWGISLTEEEIDLLARIVWLEAGGEPELGQQAVVEVILNRMASDIYPDTLYDVLSQKNPVQFCSWKNREIARPTEKEYQSIEQVLSGKTNILRNDTLYFSTKALTPNVDMRIGGHSFCY